MVLKLHPYKNRNNQEKATELFKALNTTYQNWKGNTAKTGHGGGGGKPPHNHTTQTSVQPYIL